MKSKQTAAEEAVATKEQANSSSTREEAQSPLHQEAESPSSHSKLCSSCFYRMSAPEEQDSDIEARNMLR